MSLCGKMFSTNEKGSVTNGALDKIIIVFIVELCCENAKRSYLQLAMFVLNMVGLIILIHIFFVYQKPIT